MRKNDKKAAKKHVKKNVKKIVKKNVKKIEMISGTQAADVVAQRLTKKDGVSIANAMGAFGNYIDCKNNAKDRCGKLSIAEIVDSAERMEKTFGGLADLFIDYDANLFSFTGSMISQTVSETLGYFKQLASFALDRNQKDFNAGSADGFYEIWNDFSDLTYSLVFPLVLTIFNYHHLSLEFYPAEVEEFLICKHLAWAKSLKSIEKKWIDIVGCDNKIHEDKAKVLIDKTNLTLKDHLISVNPLQVKDHINARITYLSLERKVKSSINHAPFINGIKNLQERLAKAALDFKPVADIALVA